MSRSMKQWARRMSVQWGKTIRIEFHWGETWDISKVGTKYLTLTDGRKYPIDVFHNVVRVEVVS